MTYAITTLALLQTWTIWSVLRQFEAYLTPVLSPGTLLERLFVVDLLGTFVALVIISIATIFIMKETRT